MRLPRGPHLVSVVFAVVLALAVGGLAWGATHDGSVKHGMGTAAQQASARRALALSLRLPGPMARDKSFSACGAPGDDCLTSTISIPATLSALGAAFRAAGGSLARTCTDILAQPGGDVVTPPTFSCAAEGHLAGGWFVVLLGQGWLLPGTPTPKTAALIAVESPTVTIIRDSLPSARPEAPRWVPDKWTPWAQEACTDPNAPKSEPPAAALPSAVPTGTITVPPGPVALPDCEQHATTFAVSSTDGMIRAANALARAASSAGYRIDGFPCVAYKAFDGCQVQGSLRESGRPGAVVHTFIARLTHNSTGQMTGHLTFSDQS